MKPKWIKRMWGNVLVRDARKAIRVFLLPLDIALGVPGDDVACAFSQACKRMFGSTKVAFVRTVAYVELPQPNGTTVVERFIVPAAVRRALVEFDATGKADPGGYELLPPTGRARLGARNEAQRAHGKRVLLKGRAYVRKAAGQRSDPASLRGARYGSGRVHFKRV